MTAPRAVRLAPAKINLALHVTGRRADGYHLLDSIAVFADHGDRIAVRPAAALELKVSGPFAHHAPADETDLAWRAAEAFCARAGLPSAVHVEVEKNIPAGAGLGGGSADAAAVLSALNDIADVGLSPNVLREIGLALGADVPMCLSGVALRARGIGEEIAGVEGWRPLPVVLVWPGRAVSTAEVFATLTSRENPPLPPIPAMVSVLEAGRWLASCRNDLEEAALVVSPEIGVVLAELRGSQGCLISRMSGSGSACFGLYSELAEAERAAARLRAARPDWWVKATVAR
jgi:4-diphosphocytidyl-2-C-methyl-D-erythritol kinase